VNNMALSLLLERKKLLVPLLKRRAGIAPAGWSLTSLSALNTLRGPDSTSTLLVAHPSLLRRVAVHAAAAWLCIPQVKWTH